MTDPIDHAAHMQPLKLLHVLYTGKGGLGTYFLELVDSDRNNRFAHHAVFYGIEELDPEYEQFVRERGIPFTVVRKRRGPDLLSTIRLLAAMRQPTDAIVMHSGAGAGALGGLLRRATTGCPLLQVEHTPADVKTVRDRFWTFLLRGASDRTVIFYPEHREEFISFSNRHVLIPKRPDVSFFRPAERDAGHGIRVGTHGRLSPQKDHGTLLRGFAGAARQSRVPLSLHIAGGGTERGGLERLASKLGISAQVTFHGMLDRSELRAMLQSLDIYVHTTHGETMCFAIMEAQACGLPVVGSNVRGVRDAVDDRVNGLLFPHRDSQALAGLLLELGASADLRERLGRQARAHIVKEARRQPTAEAYYDTLLEVLAERARDDA
jgi:glycosyltransferase involved in cell wall biosynthesis